MEQLFEQFCTVLVRAVVAVAVGLIIGNERARHGREAGMRTHILVALGAAMTSLISIYSAQILGNNGDILRLSAQVQCAGEEDKSKLGYLPVSGLLHDILQYLCEQEHRRGAFLDPQCEYASDYSMVWSCI